MKAADLKEEVFLNRVLSVLLCVAVVLTGVNYCVSGMHVKAKNEVYEKIWNFTDSSDLSDFDAYINDAVYGYEKQSSSTRWINDSDGTVHADGWLYRQADKSTGRWWAGMSSSSASLSPIGLSLKNFETEVSFIIRKGAGATGAVMVGFRETYPGKHNKGGDNWKFGIQDDSNSTYSGMVSVLQNDKIWIHSAGQMLVDGSVNGADFINTEEYYTLHVSVVDNNCNAEVLKQDGTSVYNKTTGLSGNLDFSGAISYYVNGDCLINSIKLKSLDNNESILPEFDSFYSSDISNLTKNPFLHVNDSKYWECDDDGTIRRIGSSNPGGEFRDMAMLYYNTGIYKDFTLDVDYKHGAGGDGRGAFVGFGGHDGTAWSVPEGGTVFWGISGYCRIRGSQSTDGKVYDQWGNTGKRVSDYSADAVHHMRITVSDGSVKVWIDDVLLFENVLGDWYEGGYLFLASNATGTEFSGFSVKGEVINPFAGMSSYYTNDLSNNELSKAEISDYWKSKNGVITRVNSNNPGGEYRDMAVLYFNIKQYKNFDFQVDYKHGAGGDGKGAFVGFGSQFGTGWNKPDSGTLLWGISGYCRIRGSGNESGTVLDGWGNTNKRVENYDAAKVHHMSVQVIEFQLKVSIDDVLLFNGNLGEWYDGGYIFIASNADNTQFSNIKLNGSVNDFSGYDAYYTGRISDEPLGNANPTDYWSEKDGVIIRNEQKIDAYNGNQWYENGNQLNNMALLYLKGDYQKYEDFELNLDYKHGTGGWGRIYIGIGGKPGVSWRDKSGGFVVFTDGSGNSLFEGNIGSDGVISRGVSGKAIDGFSSTSSHHLKISCIGGIITVLIDDCEAKTLILNDYLKGGKIFIGSNSTGATFSDVSVTDLSDGGSEDDFRGYDEWYSGDISNTPLSDVSEGTNWVIHDGLITRKAIKNIGADLQNNLEMAYLYLNEKEYTNFNVELDFKPGMNGWQRAYVGFGAELGKSFKQENGGITTFPQTSGHVHFDGNVNSNGKFAEVTFWSQYDEDGNDISMVSPYDLNDWHHMSLTVQDGYATVLIDDFSYIYEINIPSDYNGGFIYLCANSTATQYKNIAVTDLSVEIDPNVQNGWIPEKEDTEFTFDNVYEFSVADWKYKKITD